MVLNIVLVGLGGMVGSIARYLVSSWVTRALAGHTLPYGTLAVNVLGCLIIGILSGLAETRQVLSPQARLLLVIGVLGGFTTFSSFGLETFVLTRNANFGAALANISAQVMLGLLAVWFGYALARSL